MSSPSQPDPTQSAENLFAAKLKTLADPRPGFASETEKRLGAEFGIDGNAKAINAFYLASPVGVQRLLATSMVRRAPYSRQWLAAYLAASEKDSQSEVVSGVAEGAAIAAQRVALRTSLTSIGGPGTIVGQEEDDAKQAIRTLVEARMMLTQLSAITGWSFKKIHDVRNALFALEDGHFALLRESGEL